MSMSHRTAGHVVEDFRDDPLWHGIRDFQLDAPDARFPFSKRLARENGWTWAFALKVIEEYKRFSYLATRAGHPVSPSEEVDQAWHLHLLYTHSYWVDFCGLVLGRPFHHGPGAGGAAEGAKYRDWYQDTLDSYGRLFGEPAPTEFWPATAIRFRHVASYRRVNTATHWVIPKPGWTAG